MINFQYKILKCFWKILCAYKRFLTSCDMIIHSYKTYRPVKSICPTGEQNYIQCTTMAKTYYIRHYIYRKESIANGTYIQNVTPIGN